jgi:hypothetical protein
MTKQMWQVRRGTVPLLQCEKHRTKDAVEVKVTDAANCYWCLHP